MARATGFWDLNNESRTVASEVMDELWGHQLPGGSISVNYPGCKNDLKNSVESSGVTLLAFDPRVPAWFFAATQRGTAHSLHDDPNSPMLLTPSPFYPGPNCMVAYSEHRSCAIVPPPEFSGSVAVASVSLL